MTPISANPNLANHSEIVANDTVSENQSKTIEKEPMDIKQNDSDTKLNEDIKDAQQPTQVLETMNKTGDDWEPAKNKEDEKENNTNDLQKASD